jgi:hypothetical protein
MGNTAVDFKKDLNRKMRDRIETRITPYQFGDYWTGQSRPIKPAVKYAAGHIARCVDELHPRRDLVFRDIALANAGKKQKVLRSVDYGGPLIIEKATLSLPPTVDSSKIFVGNTKQGYYGVYFPSVQYKNWMSAAGQGQLPTIPVDLGVDLPSLLSYGSTAIKKSIPDIPDFSLFRFIGELRAGLPKVPLRTLAKEKKFRNIGGEYLNYQFGIAPTISDLEKLVKALQNQGARKTLKREVSKQYRVRKVLDKGSTSTSRSMTSAEWNSVQGLTGASGTITTKSEYRIWSSVVFGYAQLTELDRLLDKFDEVTGRLGILPTAIDIWNLTPWSWLIDWFVNFNDVMTNLSFLGKDGLYLHRGYLMATYTKSEVHRQSGLIFNRPYLTEGTLKFERKYRIRASPFGFGYTWKDFNPFQLSILGALGVSRMRF